MRHDGDSSFDLDSLAGQRLLVVTGKGGVGKTTLAAVLASALARRGRRTLLLEVDPRENAHRLLGAPPSGGEAVAAAPRLRLQNLQPRQVLDQVVRERLRFEPLVRRVLASPVYQHFAAGCPGLAELAVLGHALRAVRGLVPGAPAADTVVLDAPATGHGLALLTAPRLVAEAVRHGPFADLAAELAAFMGDPERCGVVVVSTAEEMPVQEALELLQGLEDGFGRPAAAVVVNALYPPFATEATGEWPELVELWRGRRAVNEREAARLRRAWGGDWAELPLLPIASGPRLVAALAQRLDPGPA